MSAERLREAARLMRSRAEAVDTTDASGREEGDMSFTWAEQIKFLIIDPDATHLSTFGHPAVALAVADLLEHTAEADEQHRAQIGHGIAKGRIYAALAVADAYLGVAP